MGFYDRIPKKVCKLSHFLQIASTRIQTLVEATPEQLRSFNDVCAICYLDMVQSAKITPCGHYFHGRCLKKWLFLNDQCPMCQANVIEGKCTIKVVLCLSTTI